MTGEIDGISWVGKFGKFFLSALIQEGSFGRVQNNLKIHGSPVPTNPSPVVLRI